MAKHQTPKVPYVEAHLQGGKQKPTAITIELSWTTSEEGAALGIAKRLHGRNTPAYSYHYIVDEAKTYRGVWDSVRACRQPRNTLSVLVCSQPHETTPMWDEGSATRVLYRTAELVADLILAYGIRPRYLDAEAEKRWRKWPTRRRGGIIVNVAGTWPHRGFLEDVNAHLERAR